MARCGALTGVARFGQVVASWAVAAACNSHTVQLLSVLHVGGPF